MNKLKELCRQLKDVVKCVPTYYSEQYEEFRKYSELCRLINAVADLSNNKVARALDYTIKEIAYASIEPNYETICLYLKQAIKDLISGMDATDMLEKYDKILYDLKNPKHKGYRVGNLIIDEFRDIDKDILKDTSKE